MVMALAPILGLPVEGIVKQNFRKIAKKTPLTNNQRDLNVYAK